MADADGSLKLGCEIVGSSGRLEVLPLEPGQRTPGFGYMRWVIVALLFSGTAINYIDRLVMGILAPDLQKQYHFDNIAYGKIQAAFALAYAFGQAAAGGWLDRVGARIGYTIALLAWSTVSMLHAVARTATQFAVARVFLGASESPCYPAAVKVIAEWLPRRERALAMGFVNAGCNVGMILAPGLVSWLALAHGWQWAFIGTGALGFVWVLFWIPLYRRPHEHSRCSPAELAHINSDASEPVNKVRWRTLFSYRQAWAFMIGKFLTDPIWWFYMTWLPKFLAQRHGLTLANLVRPLTMAYVMAGVGSVIGGWLSSAMIHRGWSVNAARKTALLITALGVMPIMLAAHVSSAWTAAALLGLAMAAHQGFSSNLYTLVSDLFPRSVCGSVAGLGGTFGYVGSTIFSGLTGYILFWAHQNYTVIFLIAGSAYLIAFAAIQLLAPRLEPVDSSDEPEAGAFAVS